MKNAIHYKNFKAELKDDGYVEGYASTFGNIDLAGEVIAPSAFTKTLKQRSQPVRFLWQHDTREPIGVIEDMRVDRKGLWFRARFDDTTRGQDARKSMKSGSTDSFSIGFRVISWKSEVVEEREVITFTEVALLEISQVTFPCNELATMTAVKAAPEGAALSPEMMGLLTDFARFLVDREAAGANQGEIAPETPAEGNPEAESALDAPEGDDAAAEASEGDDEQDAPAEGEQEAGKAPEDAESDPERPEDDEDDEDEEGKKALRDLALSFKLAEIAELLRA